MKRREFVKYSTLAGFSFSLPALSVLSSCSSTASTIHSPEFHQLTADLLKDWCDGMLAVQIHNPADPIVHGMLKCPACDVVHARFSDSVYPFLHMAKVTGDKKYLEAGIAVQEWAENVTLEDGSWTNSLEPTSWNGTTIFGAIALAEALHFHGDLLDDERRSRWMARLKRAADFVYTKFTLSFTNINYGATAIYGLKLFGEVLENEGYKVRSKEFAEGIKSWFTDPNHLLFGEAKPSDKLSPKGLYGVDLGYNVEESLNSIALYALAEKDEELLALVTKSLNSHLQFMLPDGGWDNSWGTRQFKWTYWGSRTSDGCQPGFGMMAHVNPAFGTAAVRNTELLKRCTSGGLLHGGIHYLSHGIPPCVHHTFAHAKPLAFLLDNWEKLPQINTDIPLPREIAKGITHFSDLDVTLFAKGDWRGTVSANDAIYKDGQNRHATGGSLGMLYHRKVGVLAAASMAIYKLMEPYNQQPNPGEDFAFTPRVEAFHDGIWYSNIFDRAARMEHAETENSTRIAAECSLKNAANEPITASAATFKLTYACSEESVEVTAETDQTLEVPTAFVFPIISASTEIFNQINEKEIHVIKEGGTVKILSNVPLKVKEMERKRIFNMVPGMEAIPILAFFDEYETTVKITISLT